jgi:transcriptional regulator with XRE-family HTH domain
VFGEMLRFYREQAGLSREDLADLAHVSPSTITAYETAWRVPTRPTVVDIDAVLELHTGGALTELWDRFEDGMKYQVFPAEVQDWAETVEPLASTVRWFESLIVPGLLQTEDYMRAIFSTRFGITPEGIEEANASRLPRRRTKPARMCCASWWPRPRGGAASALGWSPWPPGTPGPPDANGCTWTFPPTCALSTWMAVASAPPTPASSQSSRRILGPPSASPVFRTWS